MYPGKGGGVMRGFRTDLAMECVTGRRFAPEGVSMETEQREDVTVTTIRITSEAGARKLERAMGRYVTLSCPTLARCDAEKQGLISELVRDTVADMLPPEGELLVMGLGNRNVTADALGTRVVERMLVTRHMMRSMEGDLARKLRGVSAIAPGVLGVTGIETAELCKGLVRHVQPAAVIAIDALAAYDSERICTTIQITDTGIEPGSGVGNHRLGLNRETLGVPVVAIGVPMVVYASTIARDALTRLLERYHMPQDEAACQMLRDVCDGPLGEMVVTPREIDELVVSVAEVLGNGMNQAFHPGLDAPTLQMLMHQ